MKVRVSAWVSDRKGSHVPASLANAFTLRLNNFRKELGQAQLEAANAAQRTSLATQRRLRPKAAPRAGRDYRSIRSAIEWQPSGTGVQLNIAKLDTEAPHWIIHEIGTGQSANIRSAGTSLPNGRPKKNSATRRTVSSQVGRRISRRLVWADQAGNFAQYSSGKHQLALVGQVSGVPYRRQTLVIKREIKPQHFIQAGAKEGFRVYRRSVLAAAQSTLTKKR